MKANPFPLEAQVARKARMNAATVARFISIDDDAIGGDPNTVVERYDQYLKTANTTVLELDKSKDPAYYFLRPFTSRERALVQDYFDANKDKSEGQVQSDFEPVRRAVLEQCFVGCDDHPMLPSELPEDGSVEPERVKWTVGTPAPRGLKASVMEDEILVNAMLMFLFTISRLTEDEKN